MDLVPGTKTFRIAKIDYQILKILNTEYPDKPQYWNLIGMWLGELNWRKYEINEGIV